MTLTAATPAVAQAPQDGEAPGPAGPTAPVGASANAGPDAPFGTAAPSATGANAQAERAAAALSERQAQSSGAAATRSRLRLATVRPRIVRFAGRQAARIRFELAGKRERDVQVQLIRRLGGGERRVVRRWGLEGVAGGERQEVRWNGRKRNGSPVAPGRYAFRVKVRGEGLADASKAEGKRRFRAYPHIFPVRGPHSYGDGIGAGRGHRGQDVFARCGTKLVAARAGKVRYRAYQGSAAGHYVVISGARTNTEYVYMHLRGRAKVRPGERVRTGQVIGRVGQSGNASGCHLHFELWSGPGWYRGGSHMRSVTKKLRRWDRWG